MNRQTKAMRALGAIGERTSYAEISQATGIAVQDLAREICKLNARGLVCRANPEEQGGATAYFTVTPAGRAALEGATGEPYIPVTTVQRAIQCRPALAVVWMEA